MKNTPEVSPRKNYQAPILRKYGNINSLTQNLDMIGGSLDNSMGASNKKT
jgi:hypothetical protein